MSYAIVLTMRWEQQIHSGHFEPAYVVCTICEHMTDKLQIAVEGTVKN